MAEFPALPLFTDAVVADCNHLSDDEFGLYMRILILMWRSPECQIPAQADWLEKRLRRAINVIGPLLAEFCVSDGNFYTQKRLKSEFIWVRKNSKKQSANAKSRKSKENIVSQMAAKIEPNISQIEAPHPTPPHHVKDTNVSLPPTPSKSLKGMVQIPDWIDPQDWQDFETMRKGLKKPMTERAAKAIIKKLETYRSNGHDISTILEQSIRNSWQDVYEPKVDYQSGGRSHHHEKPSNWDKTQNAFKLAKASLAADEQEQLDTGDLGYALIDQTGG